MTILPWFAGISLLSLILPILTYAVTVWRNFGLVLPSGYAPVEETGAALASLSPGKIWTAPLYSMNLTSGEIVSAMYTITLGGLVLALGLGLAAALMLAGRKHCPVRRQVIQGQAMAGGGILAAVIGAQTTLLGCCGGGLAGALLSLAGMGSGMAAQASAWGQPVQAMTVLVLLGLNWRRHRL